MQHQSAPKLTRVGVFYDGNYFFKVSNYYKFAHKRKARISITGLHEFIRNHVATVEAVDARFCQIVDAHFFRGRFSAKSADERQQLYYDRVFDDILMGEGVVTHYLPMRNGGEKGVDVWLALEAFELAVYKRFDVLVIITGDGDFVPLARKVNSLGTRVMVIGWDFSYVDHQNQQQDTITSIHLLDEVTYPVMMHQLIDDKTRRDDPLIKNLFVEPRPEEAQPQQVATLQAQVAPTLSPVSDKRYEGDIKVIKEGFGFIRCAAFPANIFFYWNALSDCDFHDLKIGTTVSFTVGKGERGPIALDIKTK